MGQVFDALDPRNVAFVRKQRVFFVASAPRADSGHVNLSPKGLETFAVLDPHTVAYLDLVGSGIETVSHVRENGRITFLFCSFEGPPRLLRLYGRADVIEPGDPEWESLVSHFPPRPNARCVVRARLVRIADSCGYGVPLLRFEGERRQLDQWAEKRGPDGLRRYKAQHNARSLDGLPGLARLEEAP